MTSNCFFDQLPAELVYSVFSYLWAHEILVAFFGVSDRVNAILLAYRTHRLNFRSIEKDRFDLICKCIRPEQVIALALSDENDTPAQSELFFSRFRIEQFTQLQALTLQNLEYPSLQRTLPDVYKLKLLRTLTFIDTVRSDDNHLLVDESLRRVIPHLRRIHMSSGTFLPALATTKLRHLKIESESSVRSSAIRVMNALSAPSLLQTDTRRSGKCNVFFLTIHL